MSCHGNINFYSRGCVPCRTISPPSFNGLCGKVAKIALFILLILVYLNGNNAAEGENNIKYASRLPYELNSEELICTRL